MISDPALAALADAHGVATWYTDSQQRRVEVSIDVVVDVLGLLGVDVASQAVLEQAPRAEVLPPTIVIRAGERRTLPAPGEVTCEDGGIRTVGVELPADLPLGWHRLACARRSVVLVVVPSKLPEPPSTWGWMLQLYALRSTGSWGMGDLGDLATFTREAGRHGAGFVLLNPLHAIAPTLPVQASPYSPSSRRFTNPLYLRVTATDAYRAADPQLRREVDALRPDAAGDVIDYDAVWRAKEQALWLLFPPAGGNDIAAANTDAADAGPHDAGQHDAGAADVRSDTPAPTRAGIVGELAADEELAGFATYCAIAEMHGPDWRRWPEQLRRADGDAVARMRTELGERVAFHAWLQRLCRDQLEIAALEAAGVSMPVGLVHDLAVGVDPGGADAWMLADVLAAGVRVGAPPDAFNQLGQDWGLAAWHPVRLAETGYAAYRDLLRRSLRHAGGIRVDHVAGLSRLWWIPPGADAAHGTYVSYDAEAMFGILALEACRAGAVVIGEDLGTVPAAVTDHLRTRNMLGSTVLWFAREQPPAGGQSADHKTAPFTRPSRWPANALASISTHDLPTAYGFLASEHVRIRASLGLLIHDESVEQASADADRVALLAMLSALGGPMPSDARQIVVRMHRALAMSPSRLIAASLYDVLGEVRQPNMPGTVNEYPNWRLALRVSLDQVFDDPRVAEISRLLAASRPLS